MKIPVFIDHCKYIHRPRLHTSQYVIYHCTYDIHARPFYKIINILLLTNIDLITIHISLLYHVWPQIMSAHMHFCLCNELLVQVYKKFNIKALFLFYMICTFHMKVPCYGIPLALKAHCTNITISLCISIVLYNRNHVT